MCPGWYGGKANGLGVEKGIEETGRGRFVSWLEPVGGLLSLGEGSGMANCWVVERGLRKTAD